MAKQKPNQSIQTGRALPPRYNSYNPAARNGSVGQPKLTSVEPNKRSFGYYAKRVAVNFLLFLLILFVFISLWDARNISSTSKKLFGSGNVLNFLNASSLKTDANGRVYVLVAGYSADDPGHDGANLTDSIMLLSMNPSAKTGYMLSIPRDLYVDIPGYGHAKINEAYSQGGMELLQEVIQNSFDIQVGYYALVNYAAVRNVVDALGGIDVTINSPDGKLYDPNIDYATGGPLVDLTNGSHHLNGPQALNLTRARGDFLPSTSTTPVGFGQSDFQRTADQRQVFSAIKNKMNWHLILDPRKNGKILSALADNVKTNVNADEARPLFGLFNSIPNNKLQSLSLRGLGGKNYLASTYYEGSTLSPAAGLDDYTQINQALVQFSQN